MHTEADLRILAISSPSRGDGKTSTAINLAGILAQEPKIRVLLVEAELRRPAIATYLGIRHTTEGLAGMVLGLDLSLERVVHHCQPFNLDVLLAGHSSASPYDLLKLPRFGALLQEARTHYDYVIVDTPPLLPFADCRLIEKWIDGLLVVVAAHQTPRKMLTEALDSVDPTKLVGLVLNKDDHQTARYDYTYRYYAQSSYEPHKG
jgi:capsular exopolysaccharide synthesis family protein